MREHLKQRETEREGGRDRERESTPALEWDCSPTTVVFITSGALSTADKPRPDRCLPQAPIPPLPGNESHLSFTIHCIRTHLALHNNVFFILINPWINKKRRT